MPYQKPIPTTIKEVADGGSFDATTTIRALCRYLVDVRPFATTALPHPSGGPDLPSPQIAALPPRLVQLLAHHGYLTPGDIIDATDDELMAIDGIAAKTLDLIRRTVRQDNA